MTVKIRVRDFQSIEDAEIEVSGLTVITGQNNLGKSAFYRAAHGVFTNARGSKFVRLGKDQCTVDITFGDGRTVTWEKGAKHNRYIIDGKVLDKVGSGVPLELESMGVIPINASGRELWPQFAPQFTGQVFLLDQPGSVLAESIADVTRVGVLNEALRLSQSDKRTLSSELKVRQGDVTRLESVEATYKGLDTAEVLTADAATLNESVQKLRSDLAATQALRDTLQTLVELASALRGVPDILVPLGEADLYSRLGDLQIMQDMSAKSSTLTGLVQSLSDVRGVALPEDPDVSRASKLSDALALVTGYREQLTALASVASVGAKDGITAIFLPDDSDVPTQIQTLTTYQAVRSELTAHVQMALGLRAEIVTTEGGYNDAVRDVGELLDGAGECPTCGVQHTHDG